MAVVKVQQVHATVAKAVAYILNPAKTHDGALAASNCVLDPTDAAAVAEQFEWMLSHTQRGSVTGGREVLSHHVMQSFKPGEVTPEEALEIGVELVEKITGGDYLYVIATHTDQGHIHNHIHICPVHTTTHRKMRMQKQTLHDWRAMSDELCRARNLSVVPTPEMAGRRPQLAELHAQFEGRSWREQVRELIDEAAATARSWAEFRGVLESENVTVTVRNGYVTYQLPGQERAVRDWRLGAGYALPEVMSRLGRAQVREFSVMPTMSTRERNGGYLISLPHTNGELRFRVPEDAVVKGAKSVRLFLREGGAVPVFDRSGAYRQMLDMRQFEMFLSPQQMRVGMHTERLTPQGKSERHTKFLEHRQRQAHRLRESTAAWAVEFEYGHDRAAIVAAVDALGERQRALVVEQQRLHDDLTTGRVSPDEYARKAAELRMELGTVNDDIRRLNTTLKPPQPGQRRSR